MPGPRRLYVADACIILDLYSGRILRHCLRLRWFTLETTDFVVKEELIDPDGSFVVGLGLREMELPWDRIIQIPEIRTRHVELSAPDASLIVLSLMHNRILLTKDGHLIQAAAEQGIESHSTLWLMDQMVESGSLRAETALRAEIRMSLEERILDPIEQSIYRKKWGDM